MKGWRDIPMGGLILEGGTSENYKTGGWRSLRPVWDKERCISCLFCWLYCPEGAVIVEDEKVVGIDLEFCKGCGICAAECPPKVKAIEMKLESEFRV